MPNESNEIQDFLDKFYEAYYKERNPKKVCSMVSDYVVSVGLSDSEISHNKSEFETMVKRQLNEFSDPVPYFVHDAVNTDFGNHVWNCFSKISLRVMAGNWGIVRYVVRLTITIIKINGEWKICCIHCSESTEAYGKKSPFLFSTDIKKLPSETAPLSQHQVGNVLNQLMPGGIISRIAVKNYPVAIANKQFLKIAGYSDIKHYLEDQQGFFINEIHPNDVNKFIYIAKFVSNTGKQCECDYRLRRKDGSYFWIHDIARRAVSAEGKELLVSVITDISQQAERFQKIEQENGIDFLTKIYNRRGILDQIKKLNSSYHSCFVCIIDVDYFKNVNDLYSHLTGDRILAYAAKVLSDQFEKEGYVARIGGDEFAVFIPDYESISDIESKLLQASRNYKEYVNKTCPDSMSSFSMGGIYGHKEIPLREKYEKADANLYQVKSNNKGNILITCYD